MLLHAYRLAAPIGSLIHAGLDGAAENPLIRVAAAAKVIATLPGQCDILGYELSLGNGLHAGVDISVGATSERSGRAFAQWATLRPDVDVRLAEFVRTWSLNCERLREQVPAIYLEYDKAEVGGYSAPALFIRASELAGLTPTDLPLALRALIAMQLTDGEGIWDASERLFSMAPTDTCATYLGFMFSRTREVVRLCLAVPADHVQAFLSRAGVRFPEYCATLIDLAERHGWIDVGLGLERSGVMPNYGIELTPNGDRGAESILLQLVELGLTSQGMVGRVMSWLRSAPKGFRRAFSHAKVSIGADGAKAAKAYLSVAADWRTAGT